MSDIVALMQLDPFKCSKQDIAEIVKFYRERHNQYNLGAKTAGSIKAPTGKAVETAKAIASNDLDI